jgi:hypothetical protein
MPFGISIPSMSESGGTSPVPSIVRWSVKLLWSSGAAAPTSAPQLAAHDLDLDLGVGAALSGERVAAHAQQMQQACAEVVPATKPRAN